MGPLFQGLRPLTDHRPTTNHRPTNDHCTTVLLDLDGVIRHFDPNHLADVEAAHDLASGTLWAAAFEAELIGLVTTGKISRADWVSKISKAVGARAAVEAWLSARGTVDDQLMSIVDELRAGGTTVAILTNGTDTVPAEMIELGLANRFDRIFNTAEIGFAKPDPRAFQFVCDELGVNGSDVFFTDDSASKLPGAIEVGMTARLYEGVDTFRQHLTELGLGPRGID